MGGKLPPPGAPSLKIIQYFHTQVLCVALSGKVIFTVHKTKTKKLNVVRILKNSDTFTYELPRLKKQL